MCKLLKTYIISLFFLILSNQVSAQDKIAYIDLDFILSNTNIGKTIFSKLNIEENKKLEKFKIEEKQLKDEENKILASKNIISEEQLNLNIKNFQNKIEIYKKKKSVEIEKLKKKRNSEILNLLKLINPIIEKFMSENSISILLDKKNVYIASKNNDITNQLIQLINSSIK